MAKGKRSPATPRTVLTLGLSAVLLFGLGQVVLYARSDAGALFLARTLGIGGETRAADIIGREIREGLGEMHVRADSVSESLTGAARPARRWHVGLGPGASLIQVNHAVSRRVESVGGAVISGHERVEPGGRRRLTLVVGFSGRPTHELVVTTDPVDELNAEREPARMAIVLYGFGEDPESASAHFDLPVPFAAAIVPGARWSSSLFRAARDQRREIVVMLPLEPINYPNVNPGPGTILVTMNAARIATLVRRHLDQASPVTAAANHMGSLATQDMTVMTAVYKELKRHHLPFIHVKGAPGAVCKDLAADLGLVYDEPNVLFDPSPWKDDRRRLKREWDQVLDFARRRGRLMVWIPASETVLAWLPAAVATKELEGVHLVPLSAVLQRVER
jgi:polysaccharide deacetylase 2 family uncharacterized protein YibQ